MTIRIPGFAPRRHGRGFSLALLAGVLSAQAAWAQEGEEAAAFSISGAVEVGAEHDSNLNLSELESASGRSDTAAVLDAGADLSWQPAGRWSAEAGYSFTASRYQEVEGYDLDMHLLYADLSHDFDLLTLGGSYYFADAGLDGEDFLILDQYSLYAGKLLDDRWYLRGALNFTEKSFENFAERDADNKGYSLEAFWFFNQGRGNLMLGYAYEDEETQGAPYVYEADNLRLRFSQRFSLAGLDARLQLGYRWQDRDYAHLTPALGARRDDSQRVSEVSLDVNVLENLELIGEWEHGDFRSNLESADYSAHRFSLSARLAF